MPSTILDFTNQDSGGNGVKITGDDNQVSAGSYIEGGANGVVIDGGNNQVSAQGMTPTVTRRRSSCFRIAATIARGHGHGSIVDTTVAATVTLPLALPLGDDRPGFDRCSLRGVGDVPAPDHDVGAVQGA